MFWDEVSSQQDFDQKNANDALWAEVVSGTARRLAQPPAQVLQDFGFYIVQQLLFAHGSLLGPTRTTFHIISSAESTMHSLVRKHNAAPPVINTHLVNPHFMIVDYHSKRRMAALAVGIIRGIADYCGEQVEIISQTAEDAERVQIQVRLAK